MLSQPSARKVLLEEDPLPARCDDRLLVDEYGEHIPVQRHCSPCAGPLPSTRARPLGQMLRLAGHPLSKQLLQPPGELPNAPDPAFQESSPKYSQRVVTLPLVAVMTLFRVFAGFESKDQLKS